MVKFKSISKDKKYNELCRNTVEIFYAHHSEEELNAARKKVDNYIDFLIVEAYLEGALNERKRIYSYIISFDKENKHVK